MQMTILIVDDEKNIREGLADAISLENYRVLQAGDGQEALDILAVEQVDLIIADMKMPRMSGSKLLSRVIGTYPLIPVIVLTGFGSIQTAVQSMRGGAYDFLTKPVNLDRLSLIIRRALETRKTVIQNQELRMELSQHQSQMQLAGKSSVMQNLFAHIQQVADARASVLITGESGVGKELVADAIHKQSSRRDQPFVKVHCAALTETLLESELFGHEKGSFTGALSRKRGRFELADQGSIFLDEIGEVSNSIQVKILRVLQEKSFERVGGEETLEVDVRIISATNRDLKKEIQEGNFREDLFYRLNVVHLHVPSLRERQEDIPFLVARFLQEFSQENNKKIEGIDPKASTLLYNYAWPGNVRELRNCVESAVVFANDHIIHINDLPPHVQKAEQEGMIQIAQGMTLADVEREVIKVTLFAHGGNKTKTAEVLGIGRKTLHRKINEYALNRMEANVSEHVASGSDTPR